MGVNLGLGSNPNDPTDERTGLEGVTQFSSQSKVNRIIADGHPSGSFENFTMDVTGTITGHFDSGHIAQWVNWYSLNLITQIDWQK